METTRTATIADNPIAKALFEDTRWSWIWLVVRLYVGWQWLGDGIAKLQSPGWIGSKAGSVLTAWITHALTKTQGAHPDVQGWYGAFLAHAVLPNPIFWSYLVAFGETAVGIGLILGLFTGIAAFFGTVMNGSYLLAGTVSVNPILFGLATLLVLGWKLPGYYGVDRYLLPALGTPWQPGRIVAPQVAPHPN